MKLYLSSCLLPDVEVFSKFIGKTTASIKLGLILNSKDGKSPAERAHKEKELTEYFSKIGMQVQEIDLRDHLRGRGLLDAFRCFDVLWFVGGNSFCLRWAMKASDCESILKQVLEEGVVYAGDSAGAIVAGPTLKYFDSMDEPGLAPQAIYDGLNLVDFSVLPHWGSQKYAEANKKIERKLQKDGYKTKALNDGEWLLVKNGAIING